MPYSAGMEYITGNFYLTERQMQINAKYIYHYLRKQVNPWSKNAIAAMLGNFEAESNINPGIWQGLDDSDPSRGYGLAQWTPSTKFTDFCNELGISITDMESAMKRINYECDNNLQWRTSDEFPISFQNFKISNRPAYWLGGAFVYNYERPAQPNADYRGQLADKWFNFISQLKDGSMFWVYYLGNVKGR